MSEDICLTKKKERLWLLTFILFFFLWLRRGSTSWIGAWRIIQEISKNLYIILIVGRDLISSYCIWTTICRINKLSCILIYSFYPSFLVLLHSELIVEECSVSIYRYLCVRAILSLLHTRAILYFCVDLMRLSLLRSRRLWKKARQNVLNMVLQVSSRLFAIWNAKLLFWRLSSKMMGTFFWNTGRRSLFWMSCIWRWFLYTKIRLLAFLCEKCWIRKNFCRNMGKL